MLADLLYRTPSWKRSIFSEPQPRLLSPGPSPLKSSWGSVNETRKTSLLFQFSCELNISKRNSHPIPSTFIALLIKLINDYNYSMILKWFQLSNNRTLTEMLIWVWRPWFFQAWAGTTWTPHQRRVFQGHGSSRTLTWVPKLGVISPWLVLKWREPPWITPLDAKPLQTFFFKIHRHFWWLFSLVAVWFPGV